MMSKSNFEESMKNLENIVSELENGENITESYTVPEIRIIFLQRVIINYTPKFFLSR